MKRMGDNFEEKDKEFKALEDEMNKSSKELNRKMSELAASFGEDAVSDEDDAKRPRTADELLDWAARPTGKPPLSEEELDRFIKQEEERTARTMAFVDWLKARIDPIEKEYLKDEQAREEEAKRPRTADELLDWAARPTGKPPLSEEELDRFIKQEEERTARTMAFIEGVKGIFDKMEKEHFIDKLIEEGMEEERRKKEKKWWEIWK